MMITLKRIIGTFLMCLFVIACKDTDARMQDIVAHYNDAGKTIQNKMLKSMSAKITGKRKIDIEMRVESNVPTEQKEALSLFGTSVFGNLIEQTPGGQALLEEGVIFNLVFKEANGTFIDSVHVTHAKLKALEQKGQQRGSEDVATESGLPPQLKTSLQMLNRSLPVVNEEEGTSVERIDVNSKNELVYTIKVTDALKSMLTNESDRALLKESLLLDPNVRNVFGTFKKFGVAVIRFEYFDQNDAKIADIGLSERDFRN
ncbi:hypothetical protein [Flavobacterium selenitireducens]|uniref:hypothetical protein n=1 Tax=Flavobacterium selenitireducens TaxID=2722704 RepID=UPI00168A9714|nr:hypothetical protein [Flavobacterium selenitireducens]MBD3583006.1 hypothetical protein [Flavobacterium selenitireducens]